MVTKDLLKYAESNWNEFRSTVSVISKNEHTQSPLVDREESLFHFDKISESLYLQGKAPTSADGMMITANCIELIEFKSGFKKRITKDSFDKDKGRCQDGNKVCDAYWQLFFKEQAKETAELISSIRLKAIESYTTLEKHILPKCEETPTRISLKFLIVIDEDEVESMEDTLAELAGSVNIKNNHFSTIRQSLHRLVGRRSLEGNDFYYDAVNVLSVNDFSNHLRILA